MNIWKQFKAAFAGMRHDRATGGYNSNPFFGLGSLMNQLFGRFAGTQIDYSREVGELQQSRLIMAAVNFLGRALPEANLEVVKMKTDGTKKIIPDHQLVKLFQRPNKFYAGDLFWKSLGLSWLISGNVYFYKVRNKVGEVIELWYLPHHLVEPRWEQENSFIDYYAYLVDGIEHKLKPADIIHLRNGIDPHNTRLGLSDIASALREIYTDHEASNFSALLMRNCGVGPFVISPKDSVNNLSKEERERITDQFWRNLRGDKRGKPVLNSLAIEVQRTGFSPKDLDLAALRRVPEETIASLTGIPAIVLQFGAGLERSTYSNYAEAKEAAYESVIVPLWRYIQSELVAQLLTDFDKTGKLSVRFNTSEVRVLQDDQTKLFNRLTAAYRGNWMMKSEVRSKAGLIVNPHDEIYFLDETKKVREEKPKDAQENNTEN